MRPVRIDLHPLERSLTVGHGTALQDVLFDQGAEFPCGGRGRCKGCRVQVLQGAWPPTPEDQHLLSQAELEAGWRLACRGRADRNLTIHLAQWETPILADDSVFAITPEEGLGVAVDLGTTTIVAQLLDLSTGHVLAVRMGLNDQAKHGADIMSRVEFASHGDGQAVLQERIRAQIGRLVTDLLAASPSHAHYVKRIVLVGNTVMHHLFCGWSVLPLSHFPFESPHGGAQVFAAADLGWSQFGSCQVHFLPCLGGFVGSDILAGILATRLHQRPSLAALIDLGTNGEIVVGNGQRMLCASTAAGPAFEGARIEMGMRAATGAIVEVAIQEGQLRCRILGEGPPRGICGSGLVDAAAAGLNMGLILPGGRLAQGVFLPLSPPVHLTQGDIRELQLAKGAIAAGLRILLQQWGAGLADLEVIYLAGAFGNYINRASAQRIGLLPAPIDLVRPAGNTALIGAKLALFNLPVSGANYADLLPRIQHVSLHEDPEFQDVYLEQMTFPSADPVSS